MTTYRIVPDRSRVRIVARAPGHDFACEGPGVEGEVDLEDGRPTRIDARFGLAALRAGDLLGNRELKKFLDLDRRPVATASLASPDQVRVDLDGHHTTVPLRVDGAPPSAVVRLQLAFSDFGYKPPKLLFMKVRDELAVQITVHVEPLDPTSRAQQSPKGD